MDYTPYAIRTFQLQREEPNTGEYVDMAGLPLDEWLQQHVEDQYSLTSVDTAATEGRVYLTATMTQFGRLTRPDADAAAEDDAEDDEPKSDDDVVFIAR